MDGVDLNDVAMFVRVADGGGFTAAARALGVPKSTVSRSLARLERVLGVRLVHRTTRALALTDAGRAYYERVRAAVASVAEASADVVDLGKEPRGTIRVTAPTDIGQFLLADVIARFVERYPKIRFEVSLTARVVDLVAESFDLAVRASPLQDSSLVVRRLGSAGLGLYASDAYLRRRGTPARVGDLAGHEIIGFRGSRGRVPLLLAGPGGEEHVRVESGIESDDLLFVQRLVAAGAGIGMLPTFFAPACSGRGERDVPTRVLREWAVEGPALGVVSPSTVHEPRRVRLFRDFLVAEAKRLGFGRS